MARKKEERVIRAAHRKEKKSQKYLAGDDSFGSFTTQLNKLGLELRDIPGDGNCLFRALGDQVDGHSRSHLTHRRDVVRYMSDHRADFEPFVEDDVSFDQHVKLLSAPTTYAGNDAIVAFARLHQLTVVIHQLNSPLWEIHGSPNASTKQIHISYHNGDHYSSVRRVGDSSETPNNICLKKDTSHAVDGGKKKNVMSYSSCKAELRDEVCDENGVTTSYDDPHYEEDDLTHITSCLGNGTLDEYSDVAKADGGDGHANIYIDNIGLVTGCKDRKLISELWCENGCDFDQTVLALKMIMSTMNVVESPTTTNNAEVDQLSNASECSDTGSVEESTVCDDQPSSDPKSALKTGNNVTRAKLKVKQVPKTHKRRDKKAVKKAKAEVRHRAKVINESSDGNQDVLKKKDNDAPTVTHFITDDLSVLQI